MYVFDTPRAPDGVFPTYSVDNGVMTNTETLSAAGVCVIGRALVSVPDRYKPALDRIVTLPYSAGGLPADDAALVMNKAGLKASPSAITRHRRGTCQCARGTDSGRTTA